MVTALVLSCGKAAGVGAWGPRSASGSFGVRAGQTEAAGGGPARAAFVLSGMRAFLAPGVLANRRRRAMSDA